MELNRQSSSFRSLSNSKTKIALEFLRVDKARFSSSRTPIPCPPAVVELQRKKMVNKRYIACMMARKQASRENEAKERDNREDIIHDLKRNPSKTSREIAEAPVLPWPGFRYHNNGDVRTLSNVQKQRRLLASMRAGQGHRQSTVEMPFLSHNDSNDTKLKSSTTYIKSRSLDSLKLLMNRRSSSTMGRFSCDNLPTAHYTMSDFGITAGIPAPRVQPDTQSSTASFTTTAAANDRGKHTFINRLHKSAGDVTSSFAAAADGDRKLTAHNQFVVSSVPSNRSIGSSRLNLNQFRPAVKPLATSSVWCNGGEELKERASLIPKHSFNIRFGVSSKVLHQRKSDLDELKILAEKRSVENTNQIKSYIENVKRQIVP